MIRLLFVIFVTLGGFAAAALWAARGGDARDVAAEVVPGALRAAVDSAESLRSAVQTEVERLRPKAAAAAPDSAADEPLAASAEAAPAADLVAPEPKRALPSDDEPATEVRDLVPPGEFARDTGGDAEITDGPGQESADTPEEIFWTSAAPAPVPLDSDESADLIRRMLAVYRQTRQRE
jgi:hypothetical protein